MRSPKTKLASWIVIGVLALGGGVALAETAPDNPEVAGEEEVVTPAPETTTEGETAGEVEEAPEAPETDGEEGEEGDEAGEHPDNHGAVVSAAAHDHSHDEACGNHGKVVSAVAKTGELPECAGGAPATAESSKAESKAKPAKAKGGKKNK